MTLVASLANRSDEELAVLLAARPDVLYPSPPRNVSALVSRLTAWQSVTSCLNSLDRFAHQLLDALCLLSGPATAQQVAGVLGAGTEVSVEEVATGLERLVALGLAWVDAGNKGKAAGVAG
ncbi:MAG TPA: hypothetical protein VK988_09730, partial [Acidimicrobiales bacterium]|nr:hypothetical protein [Acidimicrobiales bacterium]